LKKHSQVCYGLVALVAACLLSALIGCTGKQGSSDLAAVVDGHKIYRSELEKYYTNQTAGSDQQPSGEQAASLRLNILRELIDNEILMRRAEKLGLLATDDEVDRVTDIDLLDERFAPAQEGGPIRIAQLQGRARLYRYKLKNGAQRFAEGIAVAYKCDLVVAVIVGNVADEQERKSAHRFLESNTVQVWVNRQLEGR